MKMLCPYCKNENDDGANICRACGVHLLPDMDKLDFPKRLDALNNVEYAGLQKRFESAIIDGLILYIGRFIIQFIMQLIIVLPYGITIGAGVIGTVLYFVLVWLYYALFESSFRQATLGKMARGIIVTDLEGNRISFKKATLRHFCKIFLVLTLFITYILMDFNERKQAIHDRIAGCLVIKKTDNMNLNIS
jgi:uncharacterized RDD family membrane protein YckC